MFDKEEFNENGFLVLSGFYELDNEILQKADNLMQDYSYKAGRRFLTHNVEEITHDLKKLIYNQEIQMFFNSITAEHLRCKDVMLTHDYLNKIEINQFLHFDRWRSLKAMVYLTDVTEENGAFSVVPKTHSEGARLRRIYKNLPYSVRPNRIETDFPELYEKPEKIVAPAGTLILFDSDIFHKGGDINDGNERILIRSHWYIDRKWQEEV